MGQTDTRKSNRRVLGASSADELQALPHEVVSFQKSYADGYVSDWHTHPRHQLIYSVTGLMMTDAQNVTWAVPSGFGLMIPHETAHTTRMVGAVEIQTLYVAATHADAFGTCRVISVAPFLGALIAELCAEEIRDRDSPRAAHLRQLILHDLRDAPTSPLALRFPEDPQLRRVCGALAQNPSNTWTIDQWAYEVGKSRRSFTRAFHAETGLSFRDWTQRLRCQLALARQAEGQPMERIARDLGYASKYALQAMIDRLLAR